ncbi:hypothetical protein H0H92_002372, partial [Tricholoma furcatifolium]
MTNPSKEAPIQIPVTTPGSDLEPKDPTSPGSDLEPMDPTSPAFKDQLRSKFEDYKRKYAEELDELTFEEKMEWWEKRPQLPPREGSILPEFSAWIRDVYRKYIPE